MKPTNNRRPAPLNFQQMVAALNDYWNKRGCLLLHGCDLEVGAGTFNPNTFLRAALGKPFRAAYVEPCRRPADGRYGENPNRLQHYFQYQVILIPDPEDARELYLESLAALGLALREHDLRFVHDDWQSPTLGATGLGWEIWLDGMEITQFTYFQQIAGRAVSAVELTYGLERVAMSLQSKETVLALDYGNGFTYGALFQQAEKEFSEYNFTLLTPEKYFALFEIYETEAKQALGHQQSLPAYDLVMKCSHLFNLLDARGVISVTERTRYIARIRELAKQVAALYVASHQAS